MEGLLRMRFGELMVGRAYLGGGGGGGLLSGFLGICNDVQ